jgi:hypothetical protein
MHMGVLSIETLVVRPCQLCPDGTYKPNAGDEVRTPVYKGLAAG